MKRQGKKVWAVTLLMAMAASIFPLPVLKAEAAGAGEPEVVAEYDMSHEGETLIDISGNGNNATVVGTEGEGYSFEENALHLKGGYIELPAGIIETESFSIEAEFKAETWAENAWLFCMGSNVNVWPNVKNYVFFCPSQGNNGNNDAIGKIRAGIKDTSTETLFSQTAEIKKDEYNTVGLTFEDGTVVLSVNSEQIGTLDTEISIQEILASGTSNDIMGYIGKSLYRPDPVWQGYLKSFKIKAVKKDTSDDAIVAEAMNSLNLPYNTEDKPVYGNITLPAETDNGAAVTWTTDRPDIVDVKAHANEGYDDTPTGVVTRPADGDAVVSVIAKVTYGEASDEKTFTFQVKKAVEKPDSEDFTDYFFAYFAGEGYSDGEQVYFASSQDGLKWSDLNGNNAVLTSSLGEGGVRDPYILRSAEGDKFYMIATDLKIYGGNGWGAAQTAGSQSLVVWESVDLINWSEPRLMEVSADIDAGCTWAPEAAYDEKTGEYIVFWASKVSSDNFAKHRVYYTKTRDFYSFSKPQVYIEDPTESSIDTTIIYNEEDGKYYRYTKNEGNKTNVLEAKTKTVYVESSDSLLGTWTHIPSDTLNQNQWVEGPAIFRLNNDDILADGSKWCLLLDDFGGIGYYPVTTDSLSSGVFEKPSTKYKVPTRARHGTPINVTAEEYKAVMDAWGDLAEENTEEEQLKPVLSYDFEDAKAVEENGGTLFGNAAIVKDTEKDSHVLRLDGTNGSYFAFPQGFFDGRNTFSISMDMKAEQVSGNFFTFAVGQDNNRYLFVRPVAGDSIKSVITTGSYSKEQGLTVGAGTTVEGEWMKLTLIVEGRTMKLYVNGTLIGEEKDVLYEMSDLGRNLQAYLGKSFYSNDGYFKGAFDNVNVYNRALREVEIQGGTLGDKTELRELLDKYADLDGSAYTEKSYQKFKDAYEAAQKTADNPDALEEEVAEAAKALKEAFEALEKKEDTSGGEPSDENGKGDSTDPNDTPNDTSSKNEAGSVQTGDAAPILPLAVILLAAAAVSVVMVCRKLRIRRR